MRYYIADCHFDHYALNERMDKRGFSTVEEMNEAMIKAWNSRVHKNDEVVILGDICMGKADRATEIIKQLKGKKYLVIGNHDRFLKDKSFDRSLFKEIAPYMEMNDDRRKVILCHYPIFCYNGQNRVFEDGSPTTYMLHGHIHNTFDQELVDRFILETRRESREIRGKEQRIPCNIINCFCMYSNYIPLTLNEWVKLNETRLYTK